ncbi:RNF213 [Mytilus edulis]|uniref:RNF213 n=1 Tax=Mytilus edulis TaxID=6550 RepID=A0A8S3RMW4_MYTED|nr:RNF213 [Mytilus edulis]
MFAGVESMTIELEQAEKVLNIPFHSKTWHMLIEFSKIPLYDRKLESIKVASNVFKYDSKQISFNCETIHKYEQLTAKKSSDIKMEDVIPIMHQIDAIRGIISSDLQAIILAVKNSTELLDFLREVMYGDIRFLIDAVEEHSEQYVRESTVSDLIELKRFFQPVLKGNSADSLGSLFDLLQKQIDQSGLVKIPEKIHMCRENLHSLKALYRNVANRGERTIEVIENIMRRGSFHFLMTLEREVSVKYEQEKKESKHSDADLSDLRSRALLLMNTEDRESNRTRSLRREELEKFVKIIDKAFKVTHICMQLKQAGHFDFAKYEETCNRDNLKDLKLRLQEQYEQWIASLEICRRNYYYLNFYTLTNFMNYTLLEKNMGNNEATVAILRFIDPLTENLTKIREIYRTFPLFQSVITRMFLETSSTTGIFPQAHQVLFCRRDTTFDEISLLLNRCLKTPIAASLYSIANIEMLPLRIQFLLHDEIQRLPKEGNFLLCCLCRDHEGQSFLDQFSDMLSKPNPLSNLSLKTCLNENWEQVTVVTSDTPGLGKTEFIQREAILAKKRSLCIHISGPLNRISIIEGLASLSLRSYNVLHLDIGDVSDPVELDLFLFELIVLRYVSSGSTAYALSCNDIYIEIANTVNDIVQLSSDNNVFSKKTFTVDVVR